MTFDVAFTLLVIAVSVALMARDFLSPDYLLLGALLTVAGAGVVEPEEALVGFSNSAVIAIAGLFVVAAGVRETGLVDRVVDVMFGAATSLRPVLARLTVFAAGSSAFFSNTAVVAISIPTVSRWAREQGVSPSKVLIPLSYASILGGLCTLIGTSTNVVASGLFRDSGMQGLGFFELTAVAGPLAVVGLAYLTFVAPKIVPSREDPTERAEKAVQEFVTEMKLDDPSPLVGQTVEEAGLRGVEDLYLVRIERETGFLSPVPPGERLAAEDRLTFAGALSRIMELRHLQGLRPAATGEPPEEEPGWALHRVVISPGSPLVGTKVQEADFRARYGATVLAVQRRGERMGERIQEVVLRPGDTLLVEAGPDFEEAHHDSQDFFLITRVAEHPERRRRKQRAAVALLVGMIVAAATEVLPLPIAAPAAGLGMLLTGCITPGEARRSIDWSVLVAIGSAIGIARALDVSGADALLGQGVGALAGLFGEWGLLLGIFVGTVVLTELIINQAAVALVFPVVLTAAAAQGLDPRPLALTATIAASLSFSTPLNYTTNLMIYGPGNYRFSDFTRVGLPLQLLLGVTAVTLIRLVWPLQGG